MPQTFDVHVDADGRVTLPEAIRPHLGVESNGDLRFLLHDDGSVELTAVGPVMSNALDPEYYIALRSARLDARGADVVILLSKGIPTGALQEAGHGLLVALAQNQPGAADLATTAADLLDERAWRGDSELAELLRARAAGQDRGRPAVPANLEWVAESLECDPSMGPGGFLNLDDGSVLPSEIVDDDPELAEQIESGDWLYISSEGSRAAWLDMEMFAELQEPWLGRRLHAAIEGRGAFRRFRDLVYDEPELSEAWRQFSSERSAGRAVEWLMGEGYDPAPRKC